MDCRRFRVDIEIFIKKNVFFIFKFIYIYIYIYIYNIIYIYIYNIYIHIYTYTYTYDFVALCRLGRSMIMLEPTEC